MCGALVPKKPSSQPDAPLSKTTVLADKQGVPGRRCYRRPRSTAASREPTLLGKALSCEDAVVRFKLSRSETAAVSLPIPVCLVGIPRRAHRLRSLGRHDLCSTSCPVSAQNVVAHHGHMRGRRIAGQ